MVEAKLESLVQRLEAAVAKQEALAGGASSPAQAATTGGCPLAKQFASAVTQHIETVRAKTATLANEYVTDRTGAFI